MAFALGTAMALTERSRSYCGWPSWPDLGRRWPARLVATAAEDRLNIWRAQFVTRLFAAGPIRKKSPGREAGGCGPHDDQPGRLHCTACAPPALARLVTMPRSARA